MGGKKVGEGKGGRRRGEGGRRKGGRVENVGRVGGNLMYLLRMVIH